MDGKIQLNRKNMPSYLSQELFDRWVENFDAGDISTLVPQVTVGFSLQSIDDDYGTITIERIEELIRKYLPQDDRMQDRAHALLSKVKRGEDLYKCAEEIAYPWFPRYGDYEHRAQGAVTYVRGLASAMMFSRARYGEYHHREHEITLYVHAIEDAHGDKTVLQTFEAAFCHELFHAFHFHYAGSLEADGDLFRRTDETNTVVMESLATYYERQYCLKHGIPTDPEITWQKNEPAFYPNAGAKYIGDQQKFDTILGLSRDVDAALRTLLCKGEEGRKQFYMIKNRDCAKRITMFPLKARRVCPQETVNAAIDYCRERLHGEYVSSRSKFFFTTPAMRAYFDRHYEDIEKKMYVCCQPTANWQKLVIYCELAKGKDPSEALDLLWNSPKLREMYVSCRPGLITYRLNYSVTLIDLNELTDQNGDPYPIASIRPKLEAPLCEFESKLQAIEEVLNSL